jgi:hypothetical protein
VFQSTSRTIRFDNFAFSFSGIETLRVPKTVQTIGKSCFAWCRVIQTVTFESNSQLRIIEESAFANSGLKSLIVPPTVEVIDKFSFASCKKLTDFEFAQISQLKRIEESAFFSCFSLRTLMIPNTIEFIDGSAFCIQGLESFSISGESPRFSLRDGILYDRQQMAIIRSFNDRESFQIDPSIQILGKSCFSSCPSLHHITFNGQLLRRIEESAFALSAIETITIPRKVEFIGRAVFCCCSYLRNVLFEPESKIIELGEYAFWSCSYLTNLVIPRSVQRIGKSCFAFCGTLTKVKFEKHSKLKYVGDDAFGHTKLAKVSVSVYSPIQYSNPGCPLIVKIDAPACIVQ